VIDLGKVKEERPPQPDQPAHRPAFSACISRPSYPQAEYLDECRFFMTPSQYDYKKAEKLKAAKFCRRA